MAIAYWIVQFAAAIGGSFLARAFFGPAGHLAATMPPPGHSWQAAGFEVIITFGLVLMVLNLANGPKLNGPFVPLAVGAYIIAWGTMGGPFDGASMNPARSFGPDLAIGNLSTWWVYLVGPVAGAVTAVGVAYVLRGPAGPKRPAPPRERRSTGPADRPPRTSGGLRPAPGPAGATVRPAGAAVRAAVLPARARLRGRPKVMWGSAVAGRRLGNAVHGRRDRAVSADQFQGLVPGARLIEQGGNDRGDVGAGDRSAGDQAVARAGSCRCRERR